MALASQGQLESRPELGCHMNFRHDELENRWTFVESARDLDCWTTEAALAWAGTNWVIWAWPVVRVPKVTATFCRALVCWNSRTNDPNQDRSILVKLY